MPSQRASGPILPAELPRVAGAIALLAVAAIGLRAYGAFSAAGHPVTGAADQTILVLLGVLEGAGIASCALLLTMIFRLGRKPRDSEDERVEEEPDLPWWVRPLALLMVFAILAIPAVLLYLALRGHRRTGSRLSLPAVPALGRHLGGAAHAASATGGWAVAAGVAAVIFAALAALVLAARRRGRGTGLHHPSPRPGLADSLAAAATAGTDALLGLADPRAAIIACYAAMEHSLAGAGLPPSAADTPADVLARALDGGLVRAAGAEALTTLFRLARYSDHVMSGEQRSAALRALAEIRSDLDARARHPADMAADAGLGADTDGVAAAGAGGQV